MTRPALLLLFLCLSALQPVRAQPAEAPSLILVVVVDGLRADLITPEVTPTFYRIRAEGVHFLNGHAVFPTVTRVNAASIATGSYPQAHGLVSNSMYVPSVHPTRAFSTGEAANLWTLERSEALLDRPTLAAYLAREGRVAVVVSSGSSGSAYLLNPEARTGQGVLINGELAPDSLVAFPETVHQEILARFGPAPAKEEPSYDASVDWMTEVLTDYVLPELNPAVVLAWITEPDHTQHAYGTGSEPMLAALRNDDAALARILETLDRTGRLDSTALFIVADHGFSVHDRAVGVQDALIEAGLKASVDSDDVVLASNGQSILMHVADRNRTRIAAIARFLQQQSWADVLFTAPDSASTETPSVEGHVPGTFSLDLIHLHHPRRGPDLVLTLPWSSAPNRYGYPGTHATATSGPSLPLSGPESGHGGLSPWTVRTGFIAWGAGIKPGLTSWLPAGNVDLAPTILTLLGLPVPASMDGRVLHEALLTGPDPEKVPFRTHTLTVETPGGAYRAHLQVTDYEGKQYLDKAWRGR